MITVLRVECENAGHEWQDKQSFPNVMTYTSHASLSHHRQLFMWAGQLCCAQLFSAYLTKQMSLTCIVILTLWYAFLKEKKPCTGYFASK